MRLQRVSSRTGRFVATAFAFKHRDKVNESDEDKIWNRLYPRIFLLIKENKWKWESIAAGFGLGGGVLSLIVGIVCDISVRYLTSDDSSALLKKISVVSYFLCLPLMFLGAHFLDLLEIKYLND